MSLVVPAARARHGHGDLTSISSRASRVLNTSNHDAPACRNASTLDTRVGACSRASARPARVGRAAVAAVACLAYRLTRSRRRALARRTSLDARARSIAREKTRASTRRTTSTPDVRERRARASARGLRRLPRARLSRAASLARAEVKRHARTSKRNGCHHSRAPLARCASTNVARARDSMPRGRCRYIYFSDTQYIHTHVNPYRNTARKVGDWRESAPGRLRRIPPRLVLVVVSRRLERRASVRHAHRTALRSIFGARTASTTTARAARIWARMRLSDISRSVVPRAR